VPGFPKSGKDKNMVDWTDPKSISNRSNLAETAVLTLIGLAFIPELFTETEWQFKADDIALLCVGIGTVIWYRGKQHARQTSIFPVVAVFIMLAVKILAVFVEMKDAADVGDDIGTLVLIVSAAAFITYEFIRKRKLQTNSA
jgi:hypothetical protein